MFPDALRKKLVMAAARIETVADIACELGQNFALETSVLGDHADELISIIKTTVSPARRDVDLRDTGIREYSETPHGIPEEYIESGESTQGQQTMPQIERARRTRRARSTRGSGSERGSDCLVGNDPMQGQSRLNRRGGQPQGSQGSRNRRLAGAVSRTRGGYVAGGEILVWERLPHRVTTGSEDANKPPRAVGAERLNSRKPTLSIGSSHGNETVHLSN